MLPVTVNHIHFSGDYLVELTGRKLMYFDFQDIRIDQCLLNLAYLNIVYKEEACRYRILHVFSLV